MKIAAHVTFFYVEERLKYLKKTVDSLLGLGVDTDIFIYTNKQFDLFPGHENVKYYIYNYQKNLLKFPYKSIFNKAGMKNWINPKYLTWESREIIPGIVDRYDIQLYLEDDINFTRDNLDYWMRYKDVVLKHGYNLGFLRVEKDTENDQIYVTDLTEKPGETIEIDDQKYLLNNNNPYCGFWIYPKDELKEFIKSEEWTFDFKDYGKREKSAIGWHGKNMTRYKGILIPLMKNGDQYVTVKECAVHHLPNNKIGSGVLCTVKFPIVVN